MSMTIPRRMALLGARLALAAPARDDPARQDAAFRTLAGPPGSPALEREGALLRRWTRSPRAGLWVAAAVGKDVQGAGSAAD